MPSTATITTFYVFTPSTPSSIQVIRSAEVNFNFSIFRGHLLPIDPNTATAAATRTYDLGSDDNRWRKVYGKISPSIVSTTGSMTVAGTNDYILMDSTSATTTATLFSVSGNSGANLVIKNKGTANTVLVDGSGTEVIDGTTTINLVPGEALNIITDGSAWYSV